MRPAVLTEFSNGGGFRVVGGGGPDPGELLDVRRRADLRRTERKKDSLRPLAPASPATPATPGHLPVWEWLEFDSRVASRSMASPDSSPSRARSSETLMWTLCRTSNKTLIGTTCARALSLPATKFLPFITCKSGEPTSITATIHKLVSNAVYPNVCFRDYTQIDIQVPI
jgi:hypothetical protein